MFETLTLLPVPFWLVLLLLAAGSLWAWTRRRDGTGLPTLVVLATVTAWYVGDAFYNEYAQHHAKLFQADILQKAWWQVAWFLLVFLLATPLLHRWINARYVGRGSGAMQMVRTGVSHLAFQRQLELLFKLCVAIWVVLAMVAAFLLKADVLYFFFPFFGYKAQPWSHGRLGTGLDAFSILAVYLQLLVAAVFGVVAALATRPTIRYSALLCCLLSWPYFIFDRTRNTILAVVIPGVLSWALLRLRGSLVKKAAVLGLCFIVVNAWMAFIIANRSVSSIVDALREKGFSLSKKEKVHHEGLNMYEELCWINTFIERGTYEPNWGARYFAELVNPIPRGLWPGKPMIGIDYAIARGQSGGGDAGAGVWATISTGMIGQGVVNFGLVFGPACAALLMSLWVVMLARLDLRIEEVGHLPLYGLGLILTFNLGRDITLITLYPFAFGLGLVWFLRHFHGPSIAPRPSTAAPQPTPTNTRRTQKLLFPRRQPKTFIARPTSRNWRVPAARLKTPGRFNARFRSDCN